MNLRAALAMILGFAATALAQGGDPPATAAGGSTLAGVYTDVQALRGEAVFRQSCLSCHVPTDYQGDAFRSKFVGGTAFDMFEQIRASMPQSDPGGLSRQQYADLLAYLFKLNELPAGQAEISTDAAALKAIKVEVRNPSAFRHFRTTSRGIHHGPPYLR